MNKLFAFIGVVIFLSAFNVSATAQTSLKFIDGIELKADVASYSTTVPSSNMVIVAEAKPFSAVSTSLKIATEACKSLQFKYAQLLDVDIEDVTNLSMFRFVEDWLKTRYRYGGSSKSGIDCSAFSSLLLATVAGLKIPRTAREQYAASEKISRAEIMEGDLVFFNTRGGVSHVGVYLTNNYFVHASVSDGVTISSLDDAYYSKKYIGSGRIKINSSELN
ncbi:MAG: C40 family peptidase [Gloeobacteraceae cyanobacterium ES-bin-316]|nr:C40 family peptidase [Ferruginibacter sp.]